MFAATFPGQGSQAIGMLSNLSEGCDEVRRTFEEASDALGYELWRLVQHGPDEHLNATEQTQPAMLAAGIAAWRCWVARGGRHPGVAAGHSLGEYSALAAFGALDFSDAIRTVRARGRFMQEAVPEGEGGIAAVIGLGDDEVASVCASVSDTSGVGHVSAVNFNAPGQVAIAGTTRAIELALQQAREAGARRTVRLPMSVPVHCPLMAPAASRLEVVLAGVNIGLPSVPILHNADMAGHHTDASIRSALAAQLASPVRWSRTVVTMRDRGAETIVEFGPGRVLTGLVRRIDRNLASAAVHDLESLDRALEAVANGAGECQV